MLGYVPPRFPIGLGGLFTEVEICPVCGEFSPTHEQRPDSKTVYRHDGEDYCVTL